MTIGINQKPIVITGNGTTHVEASYPLTPQSNTDGVEIYNDDGTNAVFVASGSSSIVADTTCQLVAPKATKLFRKNPNDTTISIVYGAASTSKVYATPTSGFPTIS